MNVVVFRFDVVFNHMIVRYIMWRVGLSQIACVVPGVTCSKAVENGHVLNVTSYLLHSSTFLSGPECKTPSVLLFVASTGDGSRLSWLNYLIRRVQILCSIRRNLDFSLPLIL